MILLSFLFFTALVAVLTWWLTRGDDHHSSDGYFLAGRNLSWPFIAGSLLLTNLSTEQLVGLNGSAFTDGLAVMVWEVFAVLALVFSALFMLPRFLRSGVTTVPEYLALRFDPKLQLLCNLVFLAAYAFILLPIILYTGATGLIGILDVQALIGIESRTFTLWLIVWAVGLTGSVYALFGGLRTVAVSDLLNGIGLLAGGLLIAWLGLQALGSGSLLEGWSVLLERNAGRMSSMGSAESSVPFSTIFTGVLLLHLFYWTTNQQIIQRTFAARSLAEGQKGILATGFLKLFGPLYLVVPGLMAFAMYPDLAAADQAYGRLVSDVLPLALGGFFAAVMMGAILSSYNSALNSTCTLFSLGLYKSIINPAADQEQIITISKRFGWGMSVTAMLAAPMLIGQDSIFVYLQQMNGLYFIPILAVVLTGMLSRTVPAFAARIALIGGIVVIALGYWVPPFSTLMKGMHEYHFLGLVFVLLVGFMLLMGKLRPQLIPWIQEDVHAVDMSPWPKSNLFGGILVLVVAVLYFSLS